MYFKKHCSILTVPQLSINMRYVGWSYTLGKRHTAAAKACVTEYLSTWANSRRYRAVPSLQTFFFSKKTLCFVAVSCFTLPYSTIARKKGGKKRVTWSRFQESLASQETCNCYQNYIGRNNVSILLLNITSKEIEIKALRSWLLVRSHVLRCYKSTLANSNRVYFRLYNFIATIASALRFQKNSRWSRNHKRNISQVSVGWERLVVKKKIYIKGLLFST